MNKSYQLRIGDIVRIAKDGGEGVHQSVGGTGYIINPVGANNRDSLPRAYVILNGSAIGTFNYFYSSLEFELDPERLQIMNDMISRENMERILES